MTDERQEKGAGCLGVFWVVFAMAFIALFFNWFDVRLDRIEKHLGLRDIDPIEAWRLNH